MFSLGPQPAPAPKSQSSQTPSLEQPYPDPRISTHSCPQPSFSPGPNFTPFHPVQSFQLLLPSSESTLPSPCFCEALGPLTSHPTLLGLCSAASVSPNLLIWGGAVSPGAGITEHLLFVFIFLLSFSWGQEGLRWGSHPPGQPGLLSLLIMLRFHTCRLLPVPGFWAPASLGRSWKRGWLGLLQRCRT